VVLRDVLCALLLLAHDEQDRKFDFMLRLLDADNDKMLTAAQVLRLIRSLLFKQSETRASRCNVFSKLQPAHKRTPNSSKCSKLPAWVHVKTVPLP
jgi:hypothetical protein